jgi:8-oxo-dGTP diphosphatase
MTSCQFEDLLAATRAAGINRIVVGALILRNNAILLLERRKDDYLGGIVEIPSGEVEQGETLSQALEREIEEEAGLRVVSINGYLGSFDYPSKSGRRTRQLNFLVNVRSSAVILSEHETFAWVAKADLNKYPITNETIKLVNQVL